jgi:heptaprenyl diphosphate synthase
LDPSAGPLSPARVENRATSLRETLLPIVEAAPGESLRSALLTGIEGAEDSLGAHLALQAAAAFAAEDGPRAQAAGAAIGLLEAAQSLEGRVHGLTDDRPAQDDAGPGNRAAGLAAAWLRARSAELVAELGAGALLRHGRAAGRIADGWVLEAEDLYDAGRTPERCLRAVSLTRGSLCSLAAALGGHAAELPEHEVEPLAEYGASLGVAARICDDAAALVTSLVPAPGRAGDAVTRGVYSLPVAYSLAEDPSLARSLGGAIKDEELEPLVARIRDAGGVSRAATQCRRASEDAIGSLERLDAAEELAALAAGLAGRCEEVALA